MRRFVPADELAEFDTRSPRGCGRSGCTLRTCSRGPVMGVPTNRRRRRKRTINPLLSLIGNTNATATSVAVPGTDLTGDLILYLATRVSATPNLPTGFTDITLPVTAQGTLNHRAAYRVTTGSSETISGISASTRSLVAVLRGQHSSPIGQVSAAGGTGTSAAIPSLGALYNNGSWVFVMVFNAGGTPGIPGELTSLANGNQSSFGFLHAYKGPIGSEARYLGGTSAFSPSGNYLALAVEVKSA